MNSEQVTNVMNKLRDAVNASRPGFAQLWQEVRDAAVQEAAPIARAGWNTVNWGVGKGIQWAVYCSLIGLLSTLVVHFATHDRMYTALTALTFLVGIPLYFLAHYRYPLVLWLVKFLPGNMRKGIKTYVAAAFLIGAYLFVVPVWNSPEWLLGIILLIGAAISAFSLGKNWKIVGRLSIAGIIGITIWLMLGAPKTSGVSTVVSKITSIGKVEPIVLRPDSTGSLTRRMDPGTKWTAVAVYPGHWTETLAAPPDATGFYAQPDGNVVVQKYFPSTGWAAQQEDGPLHRSTDRDLPTGMRWYNPNPTPVIIMVQFQ